MADLAHGGDNNHGELLIGSSLDIEGPSTGQLRINAPTGGRAIRITSGAADVALSHLDIEGGNPSENDQAGGGGIFSDATGLLSLRHLTVANNTVTATATSDTVYAWGGGVYSSGALTLDSSVVSDNTADAENPLATDGEAVAQGGGVLSGGNTVIMDSTIDGNTAQSTDEHDDSPGNVGNAARAFGGGLAGGVPLTIKRSTISNNTAAPHSLQGAAFAYGGGLELFAPPAGAATIELSTIAGNITAPVGVTANVHEGGGIIDFGIDSLTLQGSTVAGNGPLTGDDNNANLAPANSGTLTTLKNTIVSSPRGAASTSCDAAVTSAGFNIDSGTSCGLDPGTTPSDQEGVDPQLGPLADNGGPTQTMLPGTSSPAIDKGSAVGQIGAPQDQRGLTRPVESSVANAPGGDGSDIGAVEAQAPPAPAVTGTTPVSPTFNDLSPEVHGTTSSGPSLGEDPTSVAIFSDPGCVTVVSPPGGTPSDFSTTGITALVESNATTTLYANASNDYGISSACSTSFVAFTHDSLGPVMTIDSGPSDPSDHTPTFTFHGTDASPPVTFECSVDGAAFSACVSPFTTASLTDGSHTFRVQGTDSLGTGGAPATHHFTITTPTPPSAAPPSTATPAPKKHCKKGQKLKKGKCVKKHKK